MKPANLSFSSVIVGTMRLGEWGVKMNARELEAFIRACVELGIRDFDHADIYGGYTTEADFGAILKGKASLRQQLQLTTKCGIRFVSTHRPEHQIKSYDSTRKHIVQSVENSLQALQTDYLDVLLIHRPDFLMDPYEIAEAFERLRSAGKVRAFGVSNFTKDQVCFLHSLFPLMTHQMEVSLIQVDPVENGLLLQCQQEKIIPTAWSPLGGGAFFVSKPDEKVRRIQSIAKPLCMKYECQLDQLLYAWLAKHPSGIIPVLGTSKVERVKAAIEAQDIVLAHEDWYKLWQAAKGEEVA